MATLTTTPTMTSTSASPCPSPVAFVRQQHRSRDQASPASSSSSSFQQDREWRWRQRHQHQHQQHGRRGYAAAASSSSSSSDSSSSSSDSSSSEPPGPGGGDGYDGSFKTPVSVSPPTPPTPNPRTEVAPGWGGGGGDDELDPDGSTRRALEIAIDRTGLYRAMEAAHGGGDGPPLQGLEAHLASIIKFRGGPITLAEYMQEVLTHPEFGYYMHRDVFGTAGDFITSPEISQVFGELMGIWAMCAWEQMGRPASVRLVELGPGRGTLMADLLRGTARFEAFTAALTVHMVEVSPKLRSVQRETLACAPAPPDNDRDCAGAGAGAGTEGGSSEKNSDGGGGGGGGGGSGDVVKGGGGGGKKVYDTNDAGKYLAGIRVAANPMAHLNEDDGSSSSGTTGGGIEGDLDGGRGGGSQGGSRPEDLGWDPVDEGMSGLNGRPVEWHETLDAVPAGPTILIAHEFFDAMPVHQFTRTERGWCERLVALRGQAPRRSVANADGEATPDAEKKEGKEREPALELVLSPGLTPAGALMIPRRLEGMDDEHKQGLRQLEISPRTLAIWERIASRIEQHGGAAIAIDYGEEGPLGDTLLAIKDHKFCDVLKDPGSADLSAYVDFGAMRRVIEMREPSPGALHGGVECFGPVTQQSLLVSLGIGPRLEALIDGCKTQEEADRLIEGCTRLVSGDDAAGEGPGRGYASSSTAPGEGEREGGGDREGEDVGGDTTPPPPPGMGIRYKAIAMVSKGMGPPVGFEN